MDIKNAIVTSNFARGLQENRTLRPEQDARVESVQRPSNNASSDIDSEAIARKGRALQADRVEKLNDLDSLPLRTRQALDSYQQTESAAQQFEQGELVGVDLFI